MYDMNRILKKAEKTLNLGKEPITVNVICYGNKRGKLPPDYKQGNITIHYVKYEEMERK